MTDIDVEGYRNYAGELCVGLRLRAGGNYYRTKTQRIAALRAQMDRALTEGKLDTYRDLLESLIILAQP